MVNGKREEHMIAQKTRLNLPIQAGKLDGVCNRVLEKGREKKGKRETRASLLHRRLPRGFEAALELINNQQWLHEQRSLRGQ